MSKPRSARLHDVLAGHVSSGAMPGLVALVSRRGESHVEAIGRVAWTQRAMRGASSTGLDCGVGIEFLGGAAEQLSALEEFVSRGARGEIDH